MVKKLLASFLLFTGLAFSQAFPGSVVTNATIPFAVDHSTTTLSTTITSSSTTITVASSANFAAFQVINIDAEQIQICSVSVNILNVCVSGRGYFGTTAAAHSLGANVFGYVNAGYHNTQFTETAAIENWLLNTQPGIISTDISASTGVTGNFTVPGTVTDCKTNFLLFVGSSCYPTITSAVAASGSTGFVIIPRAYAGTEAYSVGGVNNVLDLRSSFFGVAQYIAPSRPITGYPLGNDLALEADGPADLYITHDSLDTRSHQTTSTPITVGVNTVIAMTTSTGMSPNAAVVLERELPKEEYCNIVSIPDTTHLQINCSTYSHSGTITVEQMGTTTFDRQSYLNLSTYQPAGLSHPLAPFRIGESNDGTYMKWPLGLGEAFPASAIQIAPYITGMTSHGSLTSTPGDLIFRNSDATHCARMLASNGSTTLSTFCDSQILFPGLFTPSNMVLPNNVFIDGTTTGSVVSSILGVFSDNFTKILSTSTSGGVDIQSVGGVTVMRFVNAGRTLLGGTTDDGSSTLQINSGALSIPPIKSTTGVRFVCVNTTGQLVSQAAACVGT
jgi:hypothetical protein